MVRVLVETGGGVAAALRGGSTGHGGAGVQREPTRVLSPDWDGKIMAQSRLLTFHAGDAEVFFPCPDADRRVCLFTDDLGFTEPWLGLVRCSRGWIWTLLHKVEQGDNFLLGSPLCSRDAWIRSSAPCLQYISSPPTPPYPHLLRLLRYSRPQYCLKSVSSA